MSNVRSEMFKKTDKKRSENDDDKETLTQYEIEVEKIRLC